MSFIKDAFFGGAEKRAGKKAAAGITEGIGEQRGQLATTREDFAPTIEAGDVTREQLLELIGGRGAEAEQAALGRFQESPGQKFLRERAERSLLRNQSAVGGLGGGNVLTALQEQAIGISSQQLSERKNRLAGVANVGTGAVANQANITSGISSNIAELLQGRGQARASGILGQAKGIRGGIGRLAGVFTGSGTLGKVAGAFT